MAALRERADIGPDNAPRAASSDKGYASKAKRAVARARGVALVNPSRVEEKNNRAFLARTLCTDHTRIDNGTGRFKHFKRFGSRCEKMA